MSLAWNDEHLLLRVLLYSWLLKLVTLNDVNESTDLAGNKTERLCCYENIFNSKKVLRRVKQNIKPFNKANQS